MKRIFLFSVLCMFLFSNCSKDPIGGPANCPTGYTGVNCSEEITPKKIYITGVKIKWFRAHDNNGYTWDLGLNTDADIFIKVYEYSNLLYTSSYFSNIPNSFDTYFSCNIPVSPTSSKNFYIDLYDYDSASSNEFIGGVSFASYKKGEKFPTTIQAYSSYVDAEINLRYEW